MRHHRCVPRTVDGRDYMVCVHCGAAFNDTVKAGDVMNSECPMPLNPIRPTHINAPCDPRDKWTYQGDLLIDAWHAERNGRGEK